MCSARDEEANRATANFDLHAVAGKFPATAETMLIDVRLTDETAASSRLFRIYRPIPAHFHATCDEYLLVVSGSATFVVGEDQRTESGVVLGPGQLLFFRKNMVHSIPEIHEHPLVVFSVDTPRRDPKDVTFVDLQAGSVETFLKTIGY